MRHFNFNDENFEQFQKRRQRGRVFFGFILIVVGVLYLMRMMHLFTWLDFELTWPVIMIIIGFLLGLKSGFRNNAWWILMIIGAANLTPQFMFMGRPSADYVWPGIIIIAGLAIILRPRRNRYCYGKYRRNFSTELNDSGVLNIDVSFSGKKEVVTSKDFKGGSIHASFGGVEVNLVQADFPGESVDLEINVSFGGIEIIVPSHWEIKNEIAVSFGNVEDDRTVRTQSTPENKKTLVLRGACSFGNIEIKSY